MYGFPLERSIKTSMGKEDGLNNQILRLYGDRDEISFPAAKTKGINQSHRYKQLHSFIDGCEYTSEIFVLVTFEPEIDDSNIKLFDISRKTRKARKIKCSRKHSPLPSFECFTETTRNDQNRNIWTPSINCIRMYP